MLGPIIIIRYYLDTINDVSEVGLAYSKSDAENDSAVTGHMLETLDAMTD